MLYGQYRTLKFLLMVEAGRVELPSKNVPQQSVYRFRLGLILVADVAPNQAIFDQFAARFSPWHQQTHTLASLIKCRRTGLLGVIRIDEVIE